MVSAVSNTSQLSSIYEIFRSILILNATLKKRYGEQTTKFLKFEPQGEHGIPSYPFVVINHPKTEYGMRTHRHIVDKSYNVRIMFFHDYSANEKCVEDVDACVNQIEESQDTLHSYGIDEIEITGEVSETPEKKGNSTIVVGTVNVNFTVDLDVEA
jgi:hypothetical protein